DYILVERVIAPGERGWLRLDADANRGRLNWTRPGATAAPLRAEAIRRLSLRIYCGHLDATINAPMIAR
nr:hypothetical protein [Planctomycetota bacterium]